MELNACMETSSVRIIYVGGPTVLLEFRGVRFLTDPTFDPGGGEYQSGIVTLRKISGPAVSAQQLGGFDYVLLSHDHHFDNLDHAGRAALAGAVKVFTTREGAQRLGGNSVGLEPWQESAVRTGGGEMLRVIATPARHGPEGLHRGEVTGFLLFAPDAPGDVIYISGDTVWYPGVAEVARRFPVQIAILHLGAARVPEVGPFHLTMTAAEAVEAARAFANAQIVPIHFEGWAHFSEGRGEIEKAFRSAGLSDRVHWLQPGQATEVGSPVGAIIAHEKRRPLVQP